MLPYSDAVSRLMSTRDSRNLPCNARSCENCGHHQDLEGLVLGSTQSSDWGYLRAARVNDPAQWPAIIPFTELATVCRDDASPKRSGRVPRSQGPRKLQTVLQVSLFESGLLWLPRLRQRVVEGLPKAG